MKISFHVDQILVFLLGYLLIEYVNYTFRSCKRRFYNIISLLN